MTLLPLVGAATIGAGIATGILLVITGIRGRIPDRSRPAGRLARARQAIAGRQMSARLVGALGAGLVTLVVTRWPVAAAGIGGLVGAWPALFGGAQAEQAAIARLEALVLWTESLRDTVAAHASLERVIPASTRTAPPLLAGPLTRLAGRLHSHMPMDRALHGLAADLDDPSADLVIAALILNTRRRGDQLASVLSGLAEAARQELNARTRISQGRAGLRRGVQIMVVITLVFATYLAVASRDYVAPYASFTGQIVLLVVLAMFATGFAWMRRLSTTPHADRFLTDPDHRLDATDTHLIAALTGPPSNGRPR